LFRECGVCDDAILGGIRRRSQGKNPKADGFLNCDSFRQPPVAEIIINRACANCRLNPVVWDYSLTISTCAGRPVKPPEICDAIRNAATTAGRLISLRT
jgi:hypothetical protein